MTRPITPALLARVVGLAAVARDAGDRDTQTMRPPSAQAARREDRLVHPEDRAEVDVHDDAQRDSSMLTSSLSRVMPALCTMMSSDRAASRGVLDDAPARVGGRHVELQGGAAELVRDARQGLARRRDVDADDGRPVASEHLGDLRADPPSGAGDDGDLAGQRGVPVVRGSGRRRRRTRDDLAVDVGRASGEEEPQRRRRRWPPTSTTVTRLAVAPARSSLPIERTTPSSAPAGGSQHRVGAGGSRADEDHARRWAPVASGPGPEDVRKASRSVGSARLGEVEDDRAEPLPLGAASADVDGRHAAAASAAR